MAKMAIAVIVKDTEPVNAVLLSSDNAEEWLNNYDGTTFVLDPEDDFRQDFIMLTDCIAVDVTGMDPMPGIGIGWKYVDNEWIPPVIEENELK